MKLLALLALISFSSQGAIIDDVRPYLKKTGVGTELNNNIGFCKIEIDDEYISLDGLFELSPFVELNARLVENSAKENFYLSKSTGRRPGGDECADFGGMSNFKKTLIVNKHLKTVSVVKSFRCLFDGGKETILDSHCQFK